MVRTIGLVSHLRDSLGEVLGDVADQVLLLTRLLGEDLLEEVTRLLQISILHLALVVNYATIPVLLARDSILRSLVEAVEARRVVGRQVVAATLLHIPRSITAQRVEGVPGPVDWELREVGAEAVALGILVGQSADLEDYCACKNDCQRSLNLKMTDVPGSGLRAQPGTTLVGLKAACSTSANWSFTFSFRTMRPKGR